MKFAIGVASAALTCTFPFTRPFARPTRNNGHRLWLCRLESPIGDPYTIMGSASTRHHNNWHKAQLGWTSDTLTVSTSGVYTLAPAELTGGPRMLRIARNDGTFLNLEYRQPYGIEQANGVLLHYTADIKNGGWSKCDYGGPDCPEDWVVNPKGGSAKDALMPAGTMWTTPEGVTVNIASLGATAKFDLTFPKAGAAPFCDLANTPWDNKAPACTAGPQIDGGAPDSGTGGTGGTGGAPSITMVDPTQVGVAIQVDESDVARIEVGQPATVTFDALAGRRFPATVTAIAPAAGSGTALTPSIPPPARNGGPWMPIVKSIMP